MGKVQHILLFICLCPLFEFQYYKQTNKTKKNKRYQQVIDAGMLFQDYHNDNPGVIRQDIVILNKIKIFSWNGIGKSESCRVGGSVGCSVCFDINLGFTFLPNLVSKRKSCRQWVWFLKKTSGLIPHLDFVQIKRV